MREKSFLDILTEKLEKRILENSPRENNHNFYIREEIPSWFTQIPSQKYIFTGLATDRIKKSHYCLRNSKPKARTEIPTEPRVKHRLNEEQSQAYAYFLSWRLGLSQDYTSTELKSLFRKLAHKLHPDRNQGSSSLYMELKRNFDLLNQVFD